MPGLQLAFVALDEAEPGPAWQAGAAQAFGPYQRWWLGQGPAARPRWLECRRALREHLPELVPTHAAVTDLLGGGDDAARFLSLWCPPPFLTGCAQAAWVRDEPWLLRNYDYHPDHCEGRFLRSAWHGRPVLAALDCLWGVLDGINDRGLAVALAFAGRRAVGRGFGVPLLLRAALELCDDVPSAVRRLSRLPSHMSYHVSLVDAAGQKGRLTLHPDRPPHWSETRVAANHTDEGGGPEWPEHALAVRSLEREAALRHALDAPGSTPATVTEALLRPPLFQSAWQRGAGTLYTAAYRCREPELTLCWPGHRWRLPLVGPCRGERLVTYQGTGTSAAARSGRAMPLGDPRPEPS